VQIFITVFKEFSTELRHVFLFLVIVKVKKTVSCRYCRETAGMMDWDPECRSYLCCLFGCEVWGAMAVGHRKGMKCGAKGSHAQLLLDLFIAIIPDRFLS